MSKVYIVINFKFFYVLVECRERKLDLLDINLVIADQSRIDKMICLVVFPVLKSFWVLGKSRLFKVKQQVNQLNNKRKSRVLGYRFR